MKIFFALNISNEKIIDLFLWNLFYEQYCFSHDKFREMKYFPNSWILDRITLWYSFNNDGIWGTQKTGKVSICKKQCNIRNMYCTCAKSRLRIFLQFHTFATIFRKTGRRDGKLFYLRNIIAIHFFACVYFCTAKFNTYVNKCILIHIYIQITFNFAQTYCVKIV